VTSVEQTGGEVVATLGNGTTERADLLIGADGARSVVRNVVAPAMPRYGGYTAWRGVSPVPVPAGQLTESWGVGERFGLVDIGSRTYWFATANAPEGEGEDPAERKSNLMRRFAHWHPPITAVLDATPDTSIIRNDVYFLDPLPQWSAGRIVLLGDAAHATTPGVGQGAAQALEDALALSSELTDADDPMDALARYESIRRPGAVLTLKLSRQADRAAQLRSPIACRIRNVLANHIPQRVQRRQLGRLVWHDPEALESTRP
jgi:2-polyprenyl-6-methoxyphenol hydroxylase-like FAD-dependent oxidoreductase